MTIEQRKLDHVRYALELPITNRNGFSDLRFVHRAMPDCDLSDVSLATKVGGLNFSSPLFINAMTGGAEETERINRDLAEVARRTGIAIAVGSQRAALNDQRLARTYAVVREVNPEGIVIANLGAGATPEDAQRAVDMIGANLMQVHVNVAQELTMPEGDRSFRGLAEKIGLLVETLSVPVIVKEVGNGMSAETFAKLAHAGVHIVDVGGMGGTNFVSIENARRTGRTYDPLEEWGLTTAVSLLEAQAYRGCIELIGSGGVQSALDVARCLALGAKAVGVAGAILRPMVEHGVEYAVDLVQHWLEELRVIMTLQECKTVPELAKRPIVVLGETAEWCRLRGIPLEPLARRGL